MQKMMKKIKAWWFLGKPVWIWLSVGYSWMITSALIDCKVDSSGAILVCACLLSEVWFSRASWRKTALMCGNGPVYRFEDEVTLKSKHNFLSDGYIIRWDNVLPKSDELNELDMLRIVAPPHARTDEYGKCYYANVAHAYVESVIVWCITISAIFGTGIWGYGPSGCC